MNDFDVLSKLEDLANRLGVKLRYENLAKGPIRVTGGYCRLLDDHLILIDKNDSKKRKIRLIARSLRRFDLETVFVPPALRRIINAPDKYS
ncbi:MAG: hypothetical protein M1511_11510 [Deltaproteobacteria bacterium]|jgi:ribosomal 50S subunit-associated protein YjgA (DUF615 family)|nr:hypothetical protein [Deltaproteobacteria bacterium]